MYLIQPDLAAVETTAVVMAIYLLLSKGLRRLARVLDCDLCLLKYVAAGAVFLLTLAATQVGF